MVPNSQFKQQRNHGSQFGQSLSGYHEIFMHAPIGIYISTPEGCFVSANPVWARMCGYDSPQELIDSVSDISTQIYADPAERVRFKELMEANDEVVDHEFRLRRADGSVIWVAETVRAVYDTQGEIVYYEGFATDIGKRKKAQEAIRESEERFAKAFMSSPAPQVISDIKTGRFMNVNEKWSEMLGYTRKEMIGCTSKQMGIWDDPSDRDRIVFKLHKEGRVKEESITYRTKTGEKISARWSAEKIRLGGQEMMLSMIRNETERKKAEEQARKTKQCLDFAVQAANIGLWDWNMQTGEAIFNEQWANMLGYSLQELHPVSFNTWKSLCHPEDWTVFNARLKEYLEDRIGLCECEVRMQHKDGSWIWVLDRGQITAWDEQGRPLRMSGTHTDITKLKRYEEQLTYLSLHDPLTGLYNRNYLDNELNRLAQSREFPITILSMDLDGLKVINDALGHHHGDSQLKACARILHKSFRSADIVARIGGDEFAALLPRTAAEAAQKIMRRIQSEIQTYNQQHAQLVPLSLSIGLACAEDECTDLHSILMQADDRMYQDKLNPSLTNRPQVLKYLLAAMEERDFITHGHARRVEELCIALGQRVDLSQNQLSNLALLAQVHDLGKVGIPDRVLFKTGPLTAEEWHVMRQHPEKGHRIALSTADLAMIADLILKHHERWDGQGYPLGLTGEDIPIECRILSLADSFDVMTTGRPHRKARTVGEALKEIEECSGTQFDPQLANIFLAMMSEA